MAANTDLLKKLSRRWVGQIGSGGVADATTTTIPLSSSTNLPTDTAVVATIDRVDANGSATSNLEETFIGIVSGNNLISCVRGVEGTAQAHNAGAVVEILVTAKGWNDLVDHLLTQHDQLGRHTNITACNVTASGTMTASHFSACDITALRNVAASTITASDITATRTLTASAISNTGVLTLPTATDTLAGRATTDTLTNKRITKRVLSLSAGSATPTINTDNYDVVNITAQSAAITSFTTNLTGTPVAGDTLRISITDDGTARALSWGASFESSGTVTLPSTTVVSTRLDVGFFWNTVTSKWRCVATA